MTGYTNNFVRDNPFSKLIPVEIDSKDVDQEAELLKLEGKVPNRAIIAKRMSNGVPELLFADWLPVTADEVNQEIVPMSSQDYDTLVKTLYNLPIDEKIISDFLDNPENEVELNRLLEELYALNVISKRQWQKSKPQAMSLRVLILIKIKERKKMSKTEIIKYVSAIHTSKRPAEAARISIKRLINSGDIKEINGYFTATDD